MSNKLMKKQRKVLRKAVKTGLADETLTAHKERQAAEKKQKAFVVVFKVNLWCNIALIIINIVLLYIILTN